MDWERMEAARRVREEQEAAREKEENWPLALLKGIMSYLKDQFQEERGAKGW